MLTASFIFVLVLPVLHISLNMYQFDGKASPISVFLDLENFDSGPCPCLHCDMKQNDQSKLTASMQKVRSLRSRDLRGKEQ